MLGASNVHHQSYLGGIFNLLAVKTTPNKDGLLGPPVPGVYQFCLQLACYVSLTFVYNKSSLNVNNFSTKIAAVKGIFIYAIQYFFL